MNIIVVGAGMIGKERIKALEHLNENIVCIVDPVKDESLALKYPYVKSIENCQASFDLKRTDFAFICTPHHETAPATIWAMKNGLDILVEKPLGRDLKEYMQIKSFLPTYSTINVGFNYRFYKGVRQLLNDCRNNLFGDLISVNMILSLGDPPGSEKSWRLDPKKSGPGAILDPGIHLIDLALQIADRQMMLQTRLNTRKFWKTGINEESHVICEDKSSTIFNIQASVCHWRNTFRIEVNGTDGYGIVEGRNRHYGNQTYIRGKRWGWQSNKSQRQSQELVIDYDGEDSFIEETKAVLYGCEGIQPATNIDNERCLRFIEGI